MSALKDDKFTVISESKVGSLDETMKLEWERLHAEHLRLEAEYDEHRDAKAAFWDALEAKFGPLDDGCGSVPRLRVDDDGQVFLDFCPCPVCQAAVHHITVAETVEEMVRNGTIPQQAAEPIRRYAKAVDKQLEVSKKLMN